MGGSYYENFKFVNVRIFPKFESWLKHVKKTYEGKKNDNSGIRTHALDGPAPEAGALDHSATLSLLLTLAEQSA